MDTIEKDIGAALDISLAKERPLAEIARRMQPVKSGDAIARQIASHRDAIASHDRQIMALQRACDITVRGLEGDREEAQRAFVAEASRLNRLIAEAKEEAAGKISIRSRLKRASEAALVALDPNQATREAPMAERLVPRAAE